MSVGIYRKPPTPPSSPIHAGMPRVDLAHPIGPSPRFHHCCTKGSSTRHHLTLARAHARTTATTKIPFGPALIGSQRQLLHGDRLRRHEHWPARLDRAIAYLRSTPNLHRRLLPTSGRRVHPPQCRSPARWRACRIRSILPIGQPELGTLIHTAYMDERYTGPSFDPGGGRTARPA